MDLYAGIGYFTVPYLKHARALRLIACEWNPHAVEALRRNLSDNGVADRCTVRWFHRCGSFRSVLPQARMIQRHFVSLHSGARRRQQSDHPWHERHGRSCEPGAHSE